MEFKLNKIDMDVRNRVNAATKEGKIHNKSGIKIEQHKNKNKNGTKPKFDLKKYSSKNQNKIIVNAVKTRKIEVDAFNDDIPSSDGIYGKYLDIRK